MSERIGLLGGTFNPPHLGHIRLGLEVLRLFPVDTVRYVLSAYPPHKSGTHIVDPFVRFFLLQKSLAPYTRLQADNLELIRSTPSWTDTTVEHLRTVFPDISFYFICGSESFLEIRTWFNYQALLDKIGFLVFLRNPEHFPAIEKLCHEEKIRIHSSPPALPVSREISLFSAPSETLLYSSSAIRERIQNHEPFEFMVAEPVSKIIEEKKLYV